MSQGEELDVFSRAGRVRMLLCDVDGVFTDGGLYYDSRGRVCKRFHVQDGFGVKLAQRAGLKVGVITGLDSTAVQARMEELGIEEYHAGYRNKKDLLPGICSRNSLLPEEMAYLGDDWVDGPLLSRVGLPMAVANAQPDVQAMCLWVSKFEGGRGAVREAISFILSARGDLEQARQEWLSL
ncbi:MAG: HAD hydrolase family protein [Desulfohalobiaceae bacterium]|nr:HAD hydrolase family protein [Desulfohalobiaceae bacterium]